MELNHDEKVLYDFFVTFGQVNHLIDYPLAILSIWTSDGKDPGVMY